MFEEIRNVTISRNIFSIHQSYSNKMSYLNIMHYKVILVWLYMRVITIKMKIATIDIYIKLTVENLNIT